MEIPICNECGEEYTLYGEGANLSERIRYYRCECCKRTIETREILNEISRKR